MHCCPRLLPVSCISPLPVCAKVLARSILVGPEEGPDKYLYMAQLHEGREALGHYEKGLELLRRQLADGGAGTKEAEAALRQRVCMAYCSIGELFLTDLCFDQDAETRCQVRADRGKALRKAND